MNSISDLKFVSNSLALAYGIHKLLIIARLVESLVVFKLLILCAPKALVDTWRPKIAILIYCDWGGHESVRHISDPVYFPYKPS